MRLAGPWTPCADAFPYDDGIEGFAVVDHTWIEEVLDPGFAVIDGVFITRVLMVEQGRPTEGAGLRLVSEFGQVQLISCSLTISWDNEEATVFWGDLASKTRQPLDEPHRRRSLRGVSATSGG